MSVPRANPTADGEASRTLALGLSPEDRRVLTYASAIGHEFDFRLLAAALTADEERLAEDLERLTHRGILREREGGDRFAFVQDDLRAELYQSLTSSRRRVLHRRVAEAMERKYPEPPDEIVPELGRHFFLGRVPEKSYQYNRAAALLALQADTPDAVIHHLERARMDVRQLPESPVEESAELDLFLGGMYASVGDFDQATRCYGSGLESVGSEHPRLRGQLLLGAAELRQELPAPEFRREEVDEALALLDRGGDLSGMARAHRCRAVESARTGDFRAALDETMEAIELARRALDPRLEGLLAIDLGWVFGHLGPETQAEMTPWFERGIARLASVGDFTGVARGYALLGGLLVDLRPDEALDYLARAREYFERTRNVRGTGRVGLRSAALRAALGDLDRAEGEFQQAQRLIQRAEDPLGTALLALAEGSLSERRGDAGEAERSYREAAEQADRLGARDDAADAHLRTARLMLRRGALSEADAELESARRYALSGLRPGALAQLQEVAREVSTGTRPAG